VNNAGKRSQGRGGCKHRLYRLTRIPLAQHHCSSGVFLNRMKELDISRKVYMRISFPSTLLGFVLLSGLTANSLLAQDQTTAGVSSTPTSDASSTQPHKAPDPQRQAKRMARKLGLSSDQTAKIEPILADRDQRVQDVRSNTNLAPSDRKAQLHGIARDSNSKIEAILTDTQRQQYEQMKQDRRAKRQQNQSGVPTNS
jgi:periplasmic protein CpxP/Spy